MYTYTSLFLCGDPSGESTLVCLWSVTECCVLETEEILGALTACCTSAALADAPQYHHGRYAPWRPHHHPRARQEDPAATMLVRGCA